MNKLIIRHSVALILWISFTLFFHHGYANASSTDKKNQFLNITYQGVYNPEAQNDPMVEPDNIPETELIIFNTAAKALEMLLKDGNQLFLNDLVFATQISDNPEVVARGWEIFDQLASIKDGRKTEHYNVYLKLSSDMNGASGVTNHMNNDIYISSSQYGFRSKNKYDKFIANYGSTHQNKVFHGMTFILSHEYLHVIQKSNANTHPTQKKGDSDYLEHTAHFFDDFVDSYIANSRDPIAAEIRTLFDTQAARVYTILQKTPK